MEKKKKILLLLPDSKIGGPYVSHKRISESKLSEKYLFELFYYPRCRYMLTKKFYLHLRQVISTFEPDVIHCSGLQLDGFLQVNAIKKIVKNNIPIIITVHGSSTEAIKISKIKRSIFTFLEKKTLNKVDYFFGVSNYSLKMEILKKYKCKSKGFVYNLPNLKFNGCNSITRESLNISNDDIVIISTGRIIEEKGYDILLNVILNNKNEKVKFLIVGDGDYLKNMRERTSTLKNVIYTGYVENPMPYLNISDIFILCTKHETFGTAIIEAGNFGLPAIVSNVGGVPEIIKHDYNGFLFDKNNHIAAQRYLDILINDDVFRKQMGENMKLIVNETFSEDNIIAVLDKIYMSIIKEYS